MDSLRLMVLYFSCTLQFGAYVYGGYSDIQCKHITSPRGKLKCHHRKKLVITGVFCGSPGGATCKTLTSRDQVDPKLASQIMRKCNQYSHCSMKKNFSMQILQTHNCGGNRSIAIDIEYTCANRNRIYLWSGDGEYESKHFSFISSKNGELLNIKTKPDSVSKITEFKFLYTSKLKMKEQIKGLNLMWLGKKDTKVQVCNKSMDTSSAVTFTGGSKSFRLGRSLARPFMFQISVKEGQANVSKQTVDCLKPEKHTISTDIYYIIAHNISDKTKMNPRTSKVASVLNMTAIVKKGKTESTPWSSKNDQIFSTELGRISQQTTQTNVGWRTSENKVALNTTVEEEQITTPKEDTREHKQHASTEPVLLYGERGTTLTLRGQRTKPSNLPSSAERTTPISPSNHVTVSSAERTTPIGPSSHVTVSSAGRTTTIGLPGHVTAVQRHTTDHETRAVLKTTSTDDRLTSEKNSTFATSMPTTADKESSVFLHIISSKMTYQTPEPVATVGGTETGVTTVASQITEEPTAQTLSWNSTDDNRTDTTSQFAGGTSEDTDINVVSDRKAAPPDMFNTASHQEAPPQFTWSPVNLNMAVILGTAVLFASAVIVTICVVYKCEKPPKGRRLERPYSVTGPHRYIQHHTPPCATRSLSQTLSVSDDVMGADWVTKTSCTTFKDGTGKIVTRRSIRREKDGSRTEIIDTSL